MRNHFFHSLCTYFNTTSILLCLLALVLYFIVHSIHRPSTNDKEKKIAKLVKAEPSTFYK